MIQKHTENILPKKSLGKDIETQKIVITALFHSKDNFILEINSKYLLVSFKRFYC